MINKHTPGPWNVKHREGADSMFRTEIYSEQHGGIATCEWTPKHCGNGVTETYREANALLIAAAPELLDALYDILDVMTGRKEGELMAIQNAVAAINKATGAV